jgi:hypothetical protein
MPARRPLEPLGDDAVYNSQQEDAEVRHEQESEEQLDVVKSAASGEWVTDVTERVLRQRMEHRRGFALKPPLSSSRPQPFDHPSEDAEGESGTREQGQCCHRRT